MTEYEFKRELGKMKLEAKKEVKFYAEALFTGEISKQEFKTRRSSRLDCLIDLIENYYKNKNNIN